MSNNDSVNEIKKLLKINRRAADLFLNDPEFKGKINAIVQNPDCRRKLVVDLFDYINLAPESKIVLITASGLYYNQIKLKCVKNCTGIFTKKLNDSLSLVESSLSELKNSLIILDYIGDFSTVGLSPEFNNILKNPRSKFLKSYLAKFSQLCSDNNNSLILLNPNYTFTACLTKNQKVQLLELSKPINEGIDYRLHILDKSDYRGNRIKTFLIELNNNE
jgi:hypothetical protein